MATTSIHHRWTYDVFVSFRGEDIRKTFIDHLLKDFSRKGIQAFKDDSQLPRGEEIYPQLLKAIEESRFLIVIFSKNYASSSWCLRELVKILERKQMKNSKHEVRLIFYDIKPDVVRKQTGDYAEAFAKHEVSNPTEVAKWKKALSTAANLCGWDLQGEANGYESKLIDSISREILEKLCNGPLYVGENLVGMDARVNEMNLERFIGSSEVHMIGICGIGGIGKTTLAKTIYNMMYIHFERFCFCENVKGTAKQHGLTQVLVQIIDDIMKTKIGTVSNVSQGIMVLKEKVAYKPILLVLDDVDHSDQLQALAGSPSWFCPGSLIIFTGKDRQLLSSYKVNEIYDMEILDDGEALELFSLHAFFKKHPSKDFKELSDQVLRYVQGHPLALKVLGGFLYNKSVSEWACELKRLQVYPNSQIQEVLRLSFDGLDPDQKSIFLDITSSFIGVNKDLAASVLDSCNLFADTNIRVLVDKSLITISSTMSLQMHDLIQAMAREIVREESDCPGNRSRLWNSSEVRHVLHNNKVTQAVEVLVLLLTTSTEKVYIDCKSFACMNKLRILKICDLELENFEKAKLMKESKVNYSGRLDVLSDELRLLYWHGYPFKLLPPYFYPKDIVAIDMSYSNVKNLWTTPMCFKQLKVMKLRHCRNLTNTPDFTEITNLEELVLEGCVSLLEVHTSIGMLKRLVVLNLRNCICLRSFPCTIKMYSLEVLILSGCSNIDRLPTVLGTLKNLVELCVDRTAIKELPYFSSSSSKVQALSVGDEHEGIQSRWRTSSFWPSSFLKKFQYPSSLVLPSLASLQVLKRLDVSYCNISEVSPDSIGGLSCLQHLNLSGNDFTSLPSSLSQLSQLTMLGLVGCKKLEVLPKLPSNIQHFDAIDCTSLRKLDKQQVTNNRNFSLDFTNCPELFKNLSTESLMSMFLPKGCNSMCKNVHLVLAGNRIPRWFTNQSKGNCVKVDLPPHWCYDKFRRYGVCVVFRPKSLYYTKGEEIRYNVINSDGDYLDLCYGHLGTEFSNENVSMVGSDMIWLHYFEPREGWKKAHNFVTVLFASDVDDIEMMECGVRLVCDEDIQEEETSSSMIQGLPPPTQDDAVFQSSQGRILEIIEGEPPLKKSRIV